ncbi:hypothetical protein ACOMHN_025374 [Nucella lapillus]
MAEAASETETPRKTAMSTDSFTLCSFVDEVECRVDMLRREATTLMGERASLLEIMDQLKKDCMHVDMSPEDSQELLTNMERLKVRCEAVEIHVHTVRDEGQRQSLHKVNGALEKLHTRLASSQNTSGSVVLQAQSYLNACLPEAVGPIDSRFQSMVLGCAVDDQKDIRRRLQRFVQEGGSEGKVDSSSQRDRSNDSFSEKGLSNNSARLVDQERPAASPLPSDVTYDERSRGKEMANHMSALWNASPKDLTSDERRREGGGGRFHAEDNDSDACNREENAAGFDSSS